MESRTFILRTWICALMLPMAGLVGCSSAPVYSSGRQGLFDHLARGSHGNSINPEGWPEESGSEMDRIPAGELTQIKARTAHWRWPLNSVFVTSSYGGRKGDTHEGIDLRARVGTPVYAAEKGVIAYSGSKMRGYGKLVIIKHGGGLSSVYAHNSRLLVRKGQKIRKGQRIAISGQTGRSRGPHVHFEVRKGSIALNPARLLPDPNSNSKRTIAQVSDSGRDTDGSGKKNVASRE